jgi:hypothetical protein
MSLPPDMGIDERPQAPVLNVAVGGWAGPPDGSWAEQSMVVDWVRVYETGSSGR